MSHLLLNADTAVLTSAGGQHWGAPEPELCDAVGWFPYDKFPASHSQDRNIKIALRIPPCCFLKGEVSVNTPVGHKHISIQCPICFEIFLGNVSCTCSAEWRVIRGKAWESCWSQRSYSPQFFALGFPWLLLSAKFQWTRIRLYLRMPTCCH